MLIIYLGQIYNFSIIFNRDLMVHHHSLRSGHVSALPNMHNRHDIIIDVMNI